MLAGSATDPDMNTNRDSDTPGPSKCLRDQQRIPTTPSERAPSSPERVEMLAGSATDPDDDVATTWGVEVIVEMLAGSAPDPDIKAICSAVTRVWSKCLRDQQRIPTWREVRGVENACGISRGSRPRNAPCLRGRPMDPDSRQR
jgi:hypothetical protein